MRKVRDIEAKKASMNENVETLAYWVVLFTLHFFVTWPSGTYNDVT